MSNVEYTHPDYKNMLLKWNLVTLMNSGDIRAYPVNGVTTVTSTLTNAATTSNNGDLSNWSTYLYLPDITNTDAKAISRRVNFVKGSVLYPATSRTLNGSIGTVFRKPSDIELSEPLEYLRENADGNGLSLEQSMQEAYKYTFGKGRCGLFVDFMSDTETITAEDINNGTSAARILIYPPESIVNWHTKRVGAMVILDKIVLCEPYEYTTDGYEYQYEKQYRVLEIDAAGDYKVTVCRPKDDNHTDEVFEPKDSAGNRLKVIPFQFIGSDNNDYKVDEPPLYPIAELNSKHLLNSAIRQESITTLLPTGIFGVDDTFDYDEFNKENTDGIQLGQNKAYILPGGTFSIAQAEPNDAATVEMDKLVTRMTEAGALLITPNSSNISTDTAEIQQGIDTTTIAIVGRNVEDAYNKALMLVSMFAGSNTESTISINRDYFDMTMNAQDRAAWANDVMMGNVTRDEYRTALINDGLLASDAEAIIEPITSDEDLDGE